MISNSNINTELEFILFQHLESNANRQNKVSEKLELFGKNVKY